MLHISQSVCLAKPSPGADAAGCAQPVPVQTRQGEPPSHSADVLSMAPSAGGRHGKRKEGAANACVCAVDRAARAIFEKFERCMLPTHDDVGDERKRLLNFVVVGGGASPPTPHPLLAVSAASGSSLQQDWARPSHICNRNALTPTSTAGTPPGNGTGPTGLTPAASAPGLGLPLTGNGTGPTGVEVAAELQDLIREDLASLESGRHVLYKNALRAGAKVRMAGLSVLITPLRVLINQLSVLINRLSVLINRLSVPINRLSVPINRLSVPMNPLSVPINRLSVPINRLSVPINRLSVH
jgi:hypothetical protein